MKRFVLLPFLLGAMVATAPAASAHTDHCVGQGVAVLNNGFAYPGVTIEAKSANFYFDAGIGVCTTMAHLSAVGTVTGWCGLSYGHGTTRSGHSFAFTSSGGDITFSGNVTGTGIVTPDPLHTGSCLQMTAWRFIVTYDVTQTHDVSQQVTPPLQAFCNTTTTTC